MATLAYYRKPVDSIPAPRVEYVNTDTRVGDELVVPGLQRDLQAFYDKTDSEADRAKALELLASLQLGPSSAPPSLRPATALPAYGRKESYYTMNPYQTTYSRDYPVKEPKETTAHRPQSSQGFTASHPLEGPIGDTHYTEEFHEKPNRPATPIRSGTASGSRSNKPHPLESFLVWKFPSKAKAEQDPSPWSEQLTDDMIGQVHKRLCQSTYQNDYLGIPQGFQVKSAYTLPPDWKANVPYTLDSVTRYSYQKPNPQEELQVPINRYGSNRKKPVAATGTIPTASSRFYHIKGRTTYDRHYNDNADNVVTQIREVGQKLGQEALQKYLEKTEGQEKDTISRLLNAYHRADGVTPRPPARMTVRSEVPPVSTPSSFASKNYPRTPNSARSDTKPPAHPLYKKHVQVNRPRGKYPDLRHPSRSPSAQSATPVTSFKYTQREPTSANGIKTPPQLTDFDIDVALHALQHPDTPKSLPLNCYSPGYNLN
ncbi:testis-expressed protein 26-like isoform X2 [Ostrea edulis]|uniref:testis-expressed protein 26-like isoform X2 n=1 Tax=Ostrea edulis TaxID=37623 RepID=UPI002096547B|nr:testis-expressed protein 26-like isoform X2 [Ostrea edulis]